LLPGGQTTCVPAPNSSFAVEAQATQCIAPLVKGCPKMPNLGMAPGQYVVHGAGYDHAAARHITCAEEAAPTDARFPLETWGETSYAGPREANATCSNGTWTNHAYVDQVQRKPAHLNCFSREQIRLLKEMMHYLEWTEERLNATEAVAYKWIDVSANTRMAWLKLAQTNAHRLYKESLEGKMPPAADFIKVTKAMVENSMIPRGEPPSQELCQDFQNHVLWQLKKTGGGLGEPNYIPPLKDGYPLPTDVTLTQPVSFTCSYTAEKSAVGFDYVTRTPNLFYRDGCACESRWINFCPFRLELSPSYKYFGFDAMTEKAVSNAPGSHAPNALCWYWSTPTHPEWGYLRNPHGAAYQAPSANATALMHEWLAKKQR